MRISISVQQCNVGQPCQLGPKVGVDNFGKYFNHAEKQLQGDY
jgi:hypothetical protein